jgi:hypothetical protein
MYTTKTPIDVCRFNGRDPQLQKILTFSVNDRSYQLNYFPHYLFDIRNLYIKADRFPLMMLTAANKERKQI